MLPLVDKSFYLLLTLTHGIVFKYQYAHFSTIQHDIEHVGTYNRKADIQFNAIMSEQVTRCDHHKVWVQYV